MLRCKRSWLAAIVYLGLFAGSLPAITGFPTELKCPLCGEKNILYVWASYGSYVYQYPSKFQFVFWPFTDAHNLFLCKKCYFAAFSGDWQKPPEEKIEATRKLLEGIPAPVIPKPDFAPTDKDEEKAWKSMVYMKVPASERLAIAEKVYALWSTGDEAWCHFYRVRGYHLEQEEKTAEAAAARKKALELALKLANDPARNGEKKLHLFVVGSMRYYTGDVTGAKSDFQAALALKIHQPESTVENNQGLTTYLDGIIKEFLAAIEAGCRPDAEAEKNPH